MKTAIINGKEMTKEQLFDAVKNLRARDLIEKYLIPNGIKYNGSKTSLKESKQAVIDRMIKHFGLLDEEPIAESVEQEAENVSDEGVDEAPIEEEDDNPMSDEEHDLIDALENFTEIYPDITVEEIGYRSYELSKDGEYVGVIIPTRDNVIVAYTVTETVGYDNIVDKIDKIVG